jgi:D-sedoheptulose 7-phosphate isomerase
MKRLLDTALNDLQKLLPRLAPLSGPLEKLGQAMLDCWGKRGKVMVAGNGGSAADAMHLAEELLVRFQKTRRALAAIALCDPTAVTCAGNDFGYDSVFSRQVEALGNPDDILVVFTTSGNSPNILRAVEQARSQGVLTAAFSGRDGGRLRGECDIELIVPAQTSARVQEGHKVLLHTLCEWIDERVT